MTGYDVHADKAIKELRARLDQAERERDEARAALLAPLRYEANGEAGDGQHVCEGCGEEREEPHAWRDCAERLSRLQVEGIDALVEQARREQAEIERDEAQAALVRAQEYAMRGDAKLAEQATRLASEPARIAAAEMARDVRWTLAALAAGAEHVVSACLRITMSQVEAIRRTWAGGCALADIAAAIRAARGAR